MDTVCAVVENLTGGPQGGKYITDVTNASRTMLMNIHTLQWDDYLCRSVNYHLLAVVTHNSQQLVVKFVFFSDSNFDC